MPHVIAARAIATIAVVPSYRRRWRGRGGGVWGIVLAVRCVCVRATRRVGFGGASGRAASETAPRRSAQYRVRLDAFVLHELQRYRFGYKNFGPIGSR